MIRRVVIEHWKSIEKLDLELGPLTVLVGPNGSGKSNFVDALRFVRDAVSESLDWAVSRRQGFDSLRQWSPAQDHDVRIRMELREGYFEAAFLDLTLGAGDRGYSIENESVDIIRAHRIEDQISYSRDASGHVRARSQNSVLVDEVTDQIEHLTLNTHPISSRTSSFRAKLASIEAYSPSATSMRTPQSPTVHHRLTQDGDNFPSVFKSMDRSKEGKAAREEIVSCLRPIMPGLADILIAEVSKYLVPIFQILESNGERHDFNVSQISDGTLRALGLLTALYQPNAPDVIAMEEPEQNLHPGALAVLVDSIREVSEKRQILITTHSPQLVDYFKPEEVRAVELRDGTTRIEPISADQKRAVHENLFSLGELMAAEGLYA